MSGTLSYVTALFAWLSLAAYCLARVGFSRQRPVGRAWLFLATIAVTLLLTLVKINGLSAVNLLLSLSPSLSVLSLGLVVHNYLKEALGLSALQPDELPLWAGFVLLLSVPLYASVLGLIPIDLYAYGYRFSWVYAVVIGFGAYVACRGHVGLTVVLLGALAAHYLRLLPSGNLFDALTDGVALFLALAIMLQYLGKREQRPVEVLALACPIQQVPRCPRGPETPERFDLQRSPCRYTP